MTINQNQLTMELRKCLDCGEELRGRADKKFCSDQCRNNYNNRLNRDDTTIIRRVNQVLKNNYRILCSFNTSGKTTLHRDRLTSAGFNFKYFTSILQTRKNRTYFFCYDQGYMELENSFLMLVKKGKSS